MNEEWVVIVGWVLFHFLNAPQIVIHILCFLLQNDTNPWLGVGAARVNFHEFLFTASKLRHEWLITYYNQLQCRWRSPHDSACKCPESTSITFTLLFVNQADKAKTTHPISMKLCGGMGLDPRINPFNFVDDIWVDSEFYNARHRHTHLGNWIRQLVFFAYNHRKSQSETLQVWFKGGSDTEQFW